MLLHIDVETRSPVDLITAGVYRYAAQAELICLAYAVGNDQVEVWNALEDPMPRGLALCLESGCELWAHNAEFERQIFKHCLPDVFIADDRWRCTAALAAACGLPRSLGDAARALGAPQQKDRRGAQLIRECCIPPYNVALVPELVDYCRQDVEVERVLHNQLRGFGGDELDDYAVNLRINDRGVFIDRELAELAADCADREKQRLAKRIQELTHGTLRTTSGVSVTRWVQLQGIELPERDGKVTLDKRARADLLAGELPDHVRAVLEVVDAASRSSTAKFRAAAQRADDDGRVRGAYLFNGAGQTGRYSSKGLQVHNFPRKSAEHVETLKSRMRAGELLDMDTLASMLRPMICASSPDRRLVWADWSAIEGRALAWLASDGDKLALYRDGADLYVEAYKAMYGVDEVDKAQRQLGKVAELALGYSGAIGALNNMARAYGMPAFADAPGSELVRRWRAANTSTCQLWGKLESAAIRAVASPETKVPATDDVTYYCDRNSDLWCGLPSERLLCYPQVRIEEGRYGPVVTALKGSQRPLVGQPWPRHQLWRGLLAENVTQAVAADLLRIALYNLEDHELVAHTHDEIVVECDADRVQYTQDAMTAMMTEAPSWADGLPLKVETDSGYRYGK